jgi:hypothetical protein
MKTLTIGFSKAKSKYAILSHLIRLIEGTPFSHVYITWNSSWLDLQVIYHAAGMMVHFTTSEHFVQKALIVDEFEIQLSDEAFKHIIQESMRKAGSGYSLSQLVYITIFRTCSALKIPTSWIPKNGRKVYVCSELVADILKDNISINFSKDLDFVTPSDIYSELIKHSIISKNILKSK